MDILTIDFEQPFVFMIKGETVDVTVFKTDEHGNVKFGVNAPRSIGVNREEIYKQKLKQAQRQAQLEVCLED